jgi:MscS family membrane protein
VVPVLALQAQISNSLGQPPPAHETSDDPLGRSTPRGTVLGFLKAADREDYNQAVSYLDTGQRGDLARELARQLQLILDRETSIDLSKLSRRPEGSLLNLQKPDRELVGLANTSSGKAEIWLDRVRRGDNPPIWLFSEDTLRRVPEIYEDPGNGPEIDQYLPGWLKKRPFFSIPLWTLCVLLISIPLVFLFGSLLVFLLQHLLKGLAYRLSTEAEVRAQVLVVPLRLTLFGILFVIISAYSYTVLSRGFWRYLGKVLIVFGLAWLLTKMVGIGTNLVLAQLKRMQAFEKIALARLSGRLLQIGLLSLGVLAVLYLAGVNLTAALTGLGIGGLAVAFAAQKTLENLFGGITIISDQPVRIGDVCKIGDVTGSVVDIGLRSTRVRTPDRTIVTIPNGQLATMNLENYTLRDKFWFHPTIALRQQTTVDQMQRALREIRDLLESYSNVESETARVRFIRIGNVSQDVEIFAYVLARGYDEFLAIQESLLLRILEIVESTGTALALPIQITHVVQESETGEGAPKARTAASAGADARAGH